jgi:tetratricopeptide (TPR) repeat protein
VCDRSDIARLVERALPTDFIAAVQQPFILCDLADEQGWRPKRAVAVFTVLEQARYLELAELREFLPIERAAELERLRGAGMVADEVSSPRVVSPASAAGNKKERLIRELYEAYFKLASLDPIAVLGIAANAEPNEVVDARARLLDQYSADRFAPVLEQEEHHKALKWVRGHIEAAAAELIDKRKRSFSKSEVSVEDTTQEISMKQLVRAEEAFLQGVQLLETEPCSALGHFAEASRLHDKDPLYLLYHGWSLYLCGAKPGDRREAEALIRRAVKANPTSVDASLILARVLLDQGETKRARERVRISLAFEPENQEAREFLTKIEAMMD